jgi:hypothetical protein
LVALPEAAASKLWWRRDEWWECIIGYNWASQKEVDIILLGQFVVEIVSLKEAVEEPSYI